MIHTASPSGAERSRRRQAARGFTLIEVMVALGLGMLILLALTILFSRNTGNQSELERTTRQLESARFAVDTLVEDLMHAGYFGEFNPDTLTPTLREFNAVTDPCATDPAKQGWDTSGMPAKLVMPVAIEGVAADAVVGCLEKRRPGTEAVVIRRADTSGIITMAAAKAGNLYLQLSRCKDEVDAGNSLLVAEKPDANPKDTFKLREPCPPGFVAKENDRLVRLTQRTYYIADCNDCDADDGIPTLKRVEMIDGQRRTVSIAEGVENLQLEYGLDTTMPNGDGQPDAYVTMGSKVIIGVDNTFANRNTWDNVVSVRLHVLTRNTGPTAGHTDNRTYQLGPDVAVAAPTDGFKRTLLSTTVRLVNVGMRRE